MHGESESEFPMGLQQGIIFLPCTSHAMTPGTPGISFHFPASCPLPLTFRMAPIQASVGRSSKHCRTCDRCVEGFDHHCKWLNNCIGEKNYQTFFALICLTVTLLLVQFGYAVYLFSRSFYDSAAMMGVVQSNYGSEHIDYRGWQAVLVLYLLLLAGAIMMLGELLFFHVVLVTKNMTTYDFIMAQQNAGGAAPPPNASGGSGARAALCRSGRIADESTVPAKRKPKVSLNPCKAMMTERLQGDPRSWGSVATGKPVISGNPGAGSKLGARQPGDFTAMPLPYGQPMQGMVSMASAGNGSGHQDCGNCATSSESVRASSQLQSPYSNGAGVGVQLPLTAPHYMPSSSAGHQAVAESTMCPRPQVPYTAMLAASATPYGIPNGFPAGGFHVQQQASSSTYGGPPPFLPRSPGGSSLHVGTRASADGSLHPRGNPAGPASRMSSRGMPPTSAAGGRYSYNGQPSPSRLHGHASGGAIAESRLPSDAPVGAARFAPRTMTLSQGGWMPRAPS